MGVDRGIHVEANFSFLPLTIAKILKSPAEVENPGLVFLGKQEANCMTKARKLRVSTPVLYAVDPLLHSLTLECIEGVCVKDVFLEFGANGIVEERLDDVAAQIGEAIATLHAGCLAHGDLTSSNMLVRSGTNQLVSVFQGSGHVHSHYLVMIHDHGYVFPLVLIDFFLSFTLTLPEDIAVDLYVLERALPSMYSSCGNVMDNILTAYMKSLKQWSATLNKLPQGSTKTLFHVPFAKTSSQVGGVADHSASVY